MKNILSRGNFLMSAAVGATCSAYPFNVCAETMHTKPNIVILVADDLGWNDVGYHGSKIRTPRIDRLAKEGLELDRFYVCPICSPTRAGLLTGRYPHRFGLRRTVIPPWREFGLSLDEECMPQLLEKAGYERRACLGKWHLGHSKKAYLPNSRGFTHFYGHYNGAIDYFTHEREGELDWHRNFDSSYDKGYSTTLLAKEGVRFINESTSDKPFLLYIPFNAPHSPLQAESELLTSYGFDESKELFSDKNHAYGKKGKGNTTRQTYSAMVTALDNGVGEIIDALETKGLTDNTIVLFFSDNGGHYRHGADNMPLKGGKFTVHEGGVRVPAVLRWPQRISGGKKFDNLMGYIDILPTILAATGVPIKTRNTLDGVNMLPFLLGKNQPPNRKFYLGQNAVVSQDWKLIDGELFRISQDPFEENNIADKNPKILKALETSLEKFNTLQSDIKVPDFGVGRKDFKAPKEWKIK